MITIKIMKPLLTLFKTNDSLTPLIVRLTSATWTGTRTP